MNFERGTVVSIRTDGVNVKLASGRIVKVRNGLQVRPYPGAAVLVATDGTRSEIVSRER